MPRRARFPGSWLVVLAAAACTGSTEIVTPPPPPASGFTLRFVPEPEDGATAAALGWGSGLPGLTVTLTPADSSRPPRTFTSEEDGTVAIPDLVAGDYIVEATRWLTAGERAELASGDDGDGFATRTVLRTGTGVGSTTIAVPASRRRSLVISEWAFNVGTTPGLGGYDVGGFLELYNNSDTTVFLDGLAIVKGIDAEFDYPNFPCSLLKAFSSDPGGVWSLGYQVFPGGGRDHPLAAGHFVVIATDAIDHRSLYPGAIDLSHADFEFAGTADADNPSVPNMINTGYDPDFLGHGLVWGTLGAVAAVALPFDTAAALKTVYPGSSTFVNPRIPRSALLDVVSIRTNFDGGYPECPTIIDASIDRESFRGRGRDVVAEFEWSVSRRTIPTPIDGQLALQVTRRSSGDLVRSPRSPGLP
jgi:hypothetical protein